MLLHQRVTPGAKTLFKLVERQVSLMVIEAVFALDAGVGWLAIPTLALAPSAMQHAQKGCQHNVTPQQGGESHSIKVVEIS
ncbi:hypothetical protein DZJ_08020 [Dickeya ananatis]